MAAKANAESAARPWLSILIPVYNVAPYLEECLTSILDQVDTVGQVEILLLDDKSTDGSLQLSEQIAANAPCPIRVLRHEQNRGLSAARNTLLEAATGEYVWFLDSDDKILPHAFSALYEIARSSPADVIMCDYVRKGKVVATFDGPSFQVRNDGEALIRGAFATRRLHVWSRIWKRDLFGTSIRFPEGVCFEDIATVPWLMLKASSFYYAAQPWVFYRSRNDSIMSLIAKGTFDRRRNDDLANALSGFVQDMQQIVPYPAFKTKSAIGRFAAREFVKIVKRLVRSGSRHEGGLRAEITRYHCAMEATSPVPFSIVARDYARSGHIGRLAALSLALAASKA